MNRPRSTDKARKTLGLRMGSRDDSTFVSAADFFTLLSLSMIYALVIVGAGAPGGATVVRTAHATTSSSIQPESLRTEVLYVVLTPGPQQVEIRVIPPPDGSKSISAVFSLDEQGVQPAIEWVTSAVKGSSAQFRRVICYLPSNENRAVAHKLLNSLVRQLQPQYEVQQVL